MGKEDTNDKSEGQTDNSKENPTDSAKPSSESENKGQDKESKSDGPKSKKDDAAKPEENKEDRYQIKAKGFYVSASKNFFLLQGLGIHGGMNFSNENAEEERDLNAFVGAHLIIERDFTILWEYDFGINDNDTTSVGTGKGYMNLAFQWHFSSDITFEFSVKNLLRNIRTQDGESDPNSMRELKVIYHWVY